MMMNDIEMTSLPPIMMPFTVRVRRTGTIVRQLFMHLT